MEFKPDQGYRIISINSGELFKIQQRKKFWFGLCGDWHDVKEDVKRTYPRINAIKYFKTKKEVIDFIDFETKKLSAGKTFDVVYDTNHSINIDW